MAESRERKITALMARWPHLSHIGARAIEESRSFSDTQAAYLEALARDYGNPMATAGLEVGESLGCSPAWRSAISDYMILVANNGRLPGVMREDERQAREREAHAAWQRCGSGDVLEVVAERCVRSVRHRNADLISRSFSASSSDFPAILADVANKMLQAAWSEQPRPWELLGKIRNVPSFLPVHSVKLGAVNLQLTPEGVPVAEVTPPDARGTFQLRTYTAEFGISRQAFSNDGLNAFVGGAASLAEASNRLIGDLTFNLLCSASLAGPTMLEDSLALFSTAHPSGATLATGAATPDATGVGVLLKLMRAQKGYVRAGDVLPSMNIRPRYLLVPGALESIARSTAGAQSNSELEANENPAVATALRVVVEPRLDAFSATGFYLVSDSVPGLEIGFLGGEARPKIVSERSSPHGWYATGVVDVGVQFCEHRGWARHAGA